ncbi:MAG: methyltransferase domain-containing protein [Chloroflexi bacterium]|nr:methyltransferase domain-containing protein [Chloroflexota bacterium]
MFIVRQLYDLQLLDWDIQEREKSLNEIRARLADDSKRIAAKQRIDRIAARLTELGAESIFLDDVPAAFPCLQWHGAEITYTDRFPREPRVLRVDLEHEIPVPEDSQDFLLMFYVTHVLFDHLAAFREAYRVLCPGGRLIGASAFLHWLVPEPDDYGRLSGSALRRLFSPWSAP